MPRGRYSAIRPTLAAAMRMPLQSSPPTPVSERDSTPRKRGADGICMPLALS
jgi:hypothetical protein